MTREAGLKRYNKYQVIQYEFAGVDLYKADDADTLIAELREQIAWFKERFKKENDICAEQEEQIEAQRVLIDGFCNETAQQKKEIHKLKALTVEAALALSICNDHINDFSKDVELENDARRAIDIMIPKLRAAAKGGEDADTD